jgi:hypothetical protein
MDRSQAAAHFSRRNQSRFLDNNSVALQETMNHHCHGKRVGLGTEEHKIGPLRSDPEVIHAPKTEVASKRVSIITNRGIVENAYRCAVSPSQCILFGCRNIHKQD